MTRIVSVKFRTAGKHYDFNARDLDLQAGDQVVLETDRGRALATVVLSPSENGQEESAKELKSVIRLATAEDLEMARQSASKEEEAYRFCMECIRARKMEMKLVRAEFLFDASKIVFYFTADGRVDFRELVKDLAHHFHTRIEMRQIGVRDEAKLTGGIGVCGRELCCCTFLTDFSPVSVKMAKEQGLALNPNKISGQCGRLLCCLSYEFETYCAMKKGMPRCGRKVQVGNCQAEVVDLKVLDRKVTVRTEDGQTRELPPEDLQGASPATGAPGDKSSTESEGDRESRPEKRKQTSRAQKPARKTSSPQPQGKESDSQTQVSTERTPPKPGSRRNRGRRRQRKK